MNYMKKPNMPLERLAMRTGRSREQICAEIQAAIDAAWASEAPEAKTLQNELFPEGKPTPEQFIAVLARTIAEEMLNSPALW